MAIIATLLRADTWEGQNPTKEIKKFIPQHLMVFEGSFGFGGEEVPEPVQSMKKYAETNGYTEDGDYIVIIDTQSPVDTNTHKQILYPMYHDENDFHLTWET